MVTDTCGQADGKTAGQSNNKTRQGYRQGSYVAFWHRHKVCLLKVKTTEERQGKGSPLCMLKAGQSLIPHFNLQSAGISPLIPQTSNDLPLRPSQQKFLAVWVDPKCAKLQLPFQTNGFVKGHTPQWTGLVLRSIWNGRLTIFSWNIALRVATHSESWRSHISSAHKQQ